MDKSTLVKPGPVTIFRPAVPNVSWAGKANAEVLNHSVGVWGP